MMENKDFDKFCKEFDIIDNALKMRTLIRWNGRDLVQRENVSEHTHLVVACVIYLIKEYEEKYDLRFGKFVELIAMKMAMLHDSLELLRGDILTVTKDNIPGLRELVDREESNFIIQQLGGEFTFGITADIVRLADLMACYKFLERELRYPNNDFCKEAYIACKNTFDKTQEQFLEAHIGKKVKEEINTSKFVKGYADDAGIDVVLDRDVVFLPMSTTSFDLNMHVTPKEGEMGLLCSRTSAAAKGLSVAMCPIDPNFSGNWTAIVHNVSNQIIEYKQGESFCQYIMIKIIPQDAPVKKSGKRSNSKLGGTDK